MEKDSCRVLNTEIVFPHYTNHIGTIFGGKLVELMDLTGALSAMRFAGDNVVTASIEALDFKIPVKQGDILELEGEVIYTAKTSMVLKVDAYNRENFGEKKQFCCRGYFVFVAIDSSGRPKRIPKLKVETEQERSFWEEGKLIKQRSLRRE
ncbi:MAG: acyl-CoA thioesterase [Thermodesulfobacteriota bacterium]